MKNPKICSRLKRALYLSNSHRCGGGCPRERVRAGRPFTCWLYVQGTEAAFFTLRFIFQASRIVLSRPHARCPRAQGVKNISVHSSSSLQHLPYDTASEAATLDASLLGRLSFAKQKLDEIVAAAAADPATAPGLTGRLCAATHHSLLLMKYLPSWSLRPLFSRIPQDSQGSGLWPEA